MIEVKDKKIDLKNIVEETKKSGFHSNSEDWVTFNNDKILTLYFRYADENMEIQEKFAKFLDL